MRSSWRECAGDPGRTSFAVTRAGRAHLAERTTACNAVTEQAADLLGERQEHAMTADTATYRRGLGARAADAARRRRPDRHRGPEPRRRHGKTVEAFGPPRSYAARIAPASGGSRPAFWALPLSGAAVGWLIATSAFDLVEVDASGLPDGLPAWIAPLVAVLLRIPPAVAQMRRSSRIRDPRTGKWLTPSPRGVPVVMGGFLIVLGAAVWVITLFVN
ncbi:hypothetical protein FHU33_2078 [Blastococcus colisei]|uniref:Uncharacterized protein n=1 Tax=Blastococcus colisei TaxID=1564162 RepID=A0A543PF06_9ACTN|nr:hypothetical protein [Blastococcus colisei]TQN42672.1 hypothetical protein FHU33_2078 [Blastococcus colisei]